MFNKDEVFFAKVAKSQRLFHVSREFTRIFWNELWLLAIGVWQNKTASAQSQRLIANSQSKKKKDTCRYVRFVEPLSRALQFILSVCDLCESPLNLTLGIFSLTYNVNTNYRYYQYQLPVLPIPVTGTTNTAYRYYQYQLPVLPVPRSGKKLILLLNFSRL